MKQGIIILFSFLSVLSFAQDTIKPIPTPFYPYPKPFPRENPPGEPDSSEYVRPALMQPIIGVGPGILTFYGDVRNNKSIPSISRIGYNLSISENLSRSVQFSARALFGSLGANENSQRNINFESSVRSGGLHFSYNFDNFLPQKRRVDPFILTGIEYFEFLSKTDLFDASGKKYFYWSDGSIMDRSETDANVINAVSLLRDYKYETDIRKSNASLFGKYPERSFALPVGAGVNFHITPRWNFKLGATMHFSFTDYIDGVNKTNKGNGRGDTKKDKYLETYFTLTFNLFNPNPPYESAVSEEELLALMYEDADGDGVTDFNDSCQGTPPGVTVDAKGCPPDTDADGKYDYADKEINSPAGAYVDEDGVAMSDSTIAQRWRIWSDTSNQYVVYNTITNPTSYYGGGWSKPRESTTVYRRELVILLGSYKEGVPPGEMEKLLSVPDIKSSLQPDSTTAYIAGSFSRSVDAENRKAEMIAAGFPEAKVMMINKDGSLSELSGDAMAEFKGESLNSNNPPVNLKGVVFRVQLGAYSKKLSNTTFNNVGIVIEIRTENELYKYLTSSTSSIQDAVKHREHLWKKGYKDAFIVAYKDNKRVPLASVTDGLMKEHEKAEASKTIYASPANTAGKKEVYFKVQVGAFMNEPPGDILNKINMVPGLEKRKKTSGVTQYLAGKFYGYKEAQNFKDEIGKKYGIPDAFIVAFFKEEMISVQEAIELLK